MDKETGTMGYPSLCKIGVKGSEMMQMFESLAKTEVAKLNEKAARIMRQKELDEKEKESAAQI